MSDSVRHPLDLAPDDLDRPFWEACRRHEFLLLRSSVTGQYHWPAVSDPEAGRVGMEWVPASGRGTVHTFSIIHQAFRPELADRVPYNVVVVELEEGPFFHSNVVDCPNEEIRIGMGVEVVFDDVSDEVTLPRFRPRAPSESVAKAAATSDGDPPVPDSLEEALSPRWLSAALGTRFPGIEVSRVDPGPVVSRLSTNARFHIECNGGPPDGLSRDLCVKGYFGDLGRAARVAGVPERVRDAERLYAAFANLADLSAAATPWSVIHGDAHVGNLFLDRHGHPSFLDWQLVQRGPWALDVGYHIASALTVDDRRRCERDLLRHYLERLAAHGIETPTEDEAWLALRQGFVYGFYLWAITLHVDPLVTTALLERMGTATADHDALDAVYTSAG